MPRPSSSRTNISAWLTRAQAFSREDIEFVELARDVPVLPPVSSQDFTDAFPVKPGFIRDEFDHALPNYTAPLMT